MAPVLVKHLMTSPVVTFFAEQTLPLADEIMRLKHFRHLPVVDDAGLLVGLISHRDLLAAEISTQSGLGRAQRLAIQQDVRVRDIMTAEVWTVGPEVRASAAAATLLDHRYGCLPVVEADGRLVGIVTERDFLKFAIKVMDTHD